MPILLITGGTGLLGSTWSRAAAPEWQVHLLAHRRMPASARGTVHTCDLTIPGSEQLIAEIGPDLVVHCAGLTDVDKCEADPAAAQAANVDMPRRIAEACDRARIPMIHISTDHLFSGSSAMLAEEAQPQPLNVYARSKADGERVVLDVLPAAIVLRTNFFGFGPSYRASFSDVILRALSVRESIRLFEDVYFTPIEMSVLIRAAHDLAASGANGIFHAVGDERMSKYDFGIALAHAFNLDPEMIRRDRLKDRTDLTIRPLDMSLSNAKMTAALGRRVGGATHQLQQLAASARPAKP